MYKKSRFLAWLVLTLSILSAVSSPRSISAAEKDSFKEKPVSSQSVNLTDRYQGQKPSSLKSDKRFRKAMVNTSIELFKAAEASGKKNTNILISPDSVITVLAMLENGAGGSTLSEFKKTLGGISVSKYNRYLYTFHRKISRSKLIRYRTANSLWFKKGAIKIKKAYLKKLIGCYQAQVYESPFTDVTVTDANNWAYNHTNGKIPSILQNLDPDARAIVMNAVHFKGEWADPYYSTTRRNFTDASGKKKKTNMLEGRESVYLEIDGAKGFMKYYQGANTAFVALLPPKGTSTHDYIRGLTGSDWIRGYKNRMTSGVNVQTRMPEFSYEYEASLKKPIQKIGIQHAFGSNADFRNMTRLSVNISDVIHKTYINLDKNGTEAAAVTAAIVAENSAHMEEIQHKRVYLNRPFIYAIVETNTGIPLFIGAVNHVNS